MKVVATDKAPKALGPYSQGYVHNGMFYSAGQIPINPATDTVEAETIAEQTEQACKNMGEVLKAAGTSFDRFSRLHAFWRIWVILQLSMRCMRSILHPSRQGAAWR